MAKVKFELSGVIDHYNRTLEIQVRTEKLRERLFWFLILAFTCLSFSVLNPSYVGEVSSQILYAKYGVKTPLNLEALTPVLWVLCFYLSLKYFQAVVHVERLYPYIAKLEKVLADHYPEPVFRKEGKVYEEDYPAFQNLVWFIYRIFVPFALLVLIVGLWKIEMGSGNSLHWKIADSTIAFLAIGAVSTAWWHLDLGALLGKWKSWKLSRA